MQQTSTEIETGAIDQNYCFADKITPVMKRHPLQNSCQSDSVVKTSFTAAQDALQNWARHSVRLNLRHITHRQNNVQIHRYQDRRSSEQADYRSSRLTQMLRHIGLDVDDAFKTKCCLVARFHLCLFDLFIFCMSVNLVFVEPTGRQVFFFFYSHRQTHSNCGFHTVFSFFYSYISD